MRGQEAKRFKGTGDVHIGQRRLGRVEYDLLATREEVGSKQDVRGVMRWAEEGTNPLSQLLGVDQPAALTLEDGRLWAFVATRQDGTALHVANDGDALLD